MNISKDQLERIRDDCIELLKDAKEEWDSGGREWHDNDMFAIGLAAAYIELYSMHYDNDNPMH